MKLDVAQGPRRSATGSAPRSPQLEREIWDLAGEEFTIGSPQQLSAILFDKLGLSKKRRGKTGFSTDARVLQAIRDEHPIIPKIEQWRELSKLKSTYLDALPRAARRRRPAPHDLQPDRHHHGPPVEHQPQPPEHPDPHRAGARDPRLLRGRGGHTRSSPPTTRRWSCGSSPTSPARTRSRRSSAAARTCTPPPRRGSWARRGGRSTPARARRRRWSTTGSSTGCRRSAWPTGSASSRTRRRSSSTATWSGFPAGQGVHRRDDRAGARRTAT